MFGWFKPAVSGESTHPTNPLDADGICIICQRQVKRRGQNWVILDKPANDQGTVREVVIGGLVVVGMLASLAWALVNR